MDLLLSVLGLILIATGLLVHGYDLLRSLRDRQEGTESSRKVASGKRFTVAVAFEIVGVVLVIWGGTFVS